MTSKRASRRILTAVTVSLICGGFVSCSLPQLDIMPRYGTLAADGDVAVSSTGASALADLTAMGLDDDEEAIGGRADLRWGAPHLVAMGQQSTHEGQGVLTAELSQGGVTIPLGAAVASDIDIGLYSAVLLFDLLPGDFWELGIGFGATALDLKGDFENLGNGDMISAEEIFYAPLLAANLGVRFRSLELATLAQGMSLKYGGEGGTYIDTDTFLRWKFLGGARHLRLSLVGGYRYTIIDIEYENGSTDVEWDLTLSGPYVGLEVTL